MKLTPEAHWSRTDVTLGPPHTPDELRTDQADATLVAAVQGDSELYLVMDLGGTKAYVSLMTADGSQLYSRRHMTASHDVRAGLLDSGPTDPSRGLVLDASNFKARNFPLAQKVTEYFGIPTFIDNDVNLAALGEIWKGAARGFDNVVGIMIGTGIGGGLIIDGELYRGRNSTAGEIGHMILDFDSAVECGCGQRGCFETLASRRAMARELHARKAANGQTDTMWDEGNLRSSEIAYHYNAGDPDAVEVVTSAARICGKAVFTILNLLNPEIVVFNGGFVYQLGDRFLAPILEAWRK